jgi:hypothetical protein
MAAPSATRTSPQTIASEIGFRTRLAGIATDQEWDMLSLDGTR